MLSVLDKVGRGLSCTSGRINADVVDTGGDIAVLDAPSHRIFRGLVADRSFGLVPKVAQKAEVPAEHSVLAPDVDPTATATPVEPGAPVPDIEKTGDAMRPSAYRSRSLSVLTVLAVLYSLYFARAFLVPIVFAILLNFLLSPVVRALVRWRISCWSWRLAFGNCAAGLG